MNEHINPTLQIKQKKCPTCNTVFNCGAGESDKSCWCNNFPAIFPMGFATSCLCPDCLKKEAIIKINEYVNSLSPEEALNNKAKDLPKTKELIEDIDYYIENGNYIFTAWYHLKKGICCHNACRHCPYKLKK